MQLRPYQQQAINDLRAAYRAGHRAPLLVLPTGAGKTVVFSAITQAAAAKGLNVLILVHRRELIRQTSNKLTAIGVSHGIIAAGHHASNEAIQVASVQTVIRRLSTITSPPDFIIIDECHHACSNSWRTIIDHFPDAFRLGVTATPCRLDGRGLGTIFDALINGPSMQDLSAAGYLSASRIYAPPPIADLSGLRVRGGDYKSEEAADRLNKPVVTGNAIDHWQRLASGLSTIAFCCTTKHAESVAQQFCTAGIRAATLLGTTPTDQRDRIVADLASGVLQVLVTVDVVSEGFDCPAAAAAVLLRPTKSEALYLQQVGRVLRPAPGKDAAIILDHVGNVIKHGFPDDHRDWSLAEGIKKSRAAAAPSVRTCPSCYAAFKPAPACPVCGTECAPPPKTMKQVAGELQELKRETARIHRQEQGKARTLQELIHLGQARRMKNPVGWAKYVMYGRSLKGY